MRGRPQSFLSQVAQTVGVTEVFWLYIRHYKIETYALIKKTRALNPDRRSIISLMPRIGRPRVENFVVSSTACGLGPLSSKGWGRTRLWSQPVNFDPRAVELQFVKIKITDDG